MELFTSSGLQAGVVDRSSGLFGHGISILSTVEMIDNNFMVAHVEP